MALTPAYFLIFGIINGGLGALGFKRAGSRASLIAGGSSGLLLILAAVLWLLGAPTPGKWLGLVVCVLLAGRFLPVYLKTKAIYPAGIIALLSVLGVVIALAA